MLLVHHMCMHTSMLVSYQLEYNLSTQVYTHTHTTQYANRVGAMHTLQSMHTHNIITVFIHKNNNMRTYLLVMYYAQYTCTCVVHITHIMNTSSYIHVTCRRVIITYIRSYMTVIMYTTTLVVHVIFTLYLHVCFYISCCIQSRYLEDRGIRDRPDYKIYISNIHQSSRAIERRVNLIPNRKALTPWGIDRQSCRTDCLPVYAIRSFCWSTPSSRPVRSRDKTRSTSQPCHLTATEP